VSVPDQSLCMPNQSLGILSSPESKELQRDVGHAGLVGRNEGVERKGAEEMRDERDGMRWGWCGGKQFWW
jgi:hypothetical protein